MSVDPVISRLDRIESALAARLGLNLSDFDGQEILSARAAKLEQAGNQAAALVKQAFVEPDLTIDQRLSRIESALRSGGALV